MTSTADLQRDQVEYWNSSGGDRWVAASEHTDRMLAPVLDLLLERASPKAGMSVLDIGCGCGASTLELAKLTGPSGRVLGVDVSHQMVAAAKAHLSGYGQAELIEADASAYPFEQFADLAISRFGVMFFGDPAAAFANIRKAVKPGGRLLFACWRTPGENLWMRAPLDALLKAGVPEAHRPGPEEPGPFSLADPERVTRILAEAGFLDPSLSPVDLQLDIAAGGGLEAAIQQAMTIGPAAAALREQPESIRVAARAFIAKALAAYAKGDAVLLPAAIWLVEAKAP